MENSELKQRQIQAAAEYAEEFGIVEYKVQGWYLVYNVSYPAYLGNPRYTWQFKVDLRTKRIADRKQLKRYDPKGIYNRH